jgi:hypothetical protein
MSRVASGAAGGVGRPDGQGDEGYGDIAGPPALDRSQPVNRTDLAPWEERASLPPALAADAETLAPLTQFLGPALTVANQAWSRDPLPGLRALQRRLVDYSLTLDTAERGDSMAAILVVEDAVRLRLRLQQMELAPAGQGPSGAPGASGNAPANAPGGAANHAPNHEPNGGPQ